MGERGRGRRASQHGENKPATIRLEKPAVRSMASRAMLRDPTFNSRSICVSMQSDPDDRRSRRHLSTLSSAHIPRSYATRCRSLGYLMMSTTQTSGKIRGCFRKHQARGANVGSRWPTRNGMCFRRVDYKAIFPRGRWSLDITHETLSHIFTHEILNRPQQMTPRSRK
jgi:hypothetical protein